MSTCYFYRLKYFNYDHLPEKLQKISKPFHDLAHMLVHNADNGHHFNETDKALEKLLEAKDCAVRAALK